MAVSMLTGCALSDKVTSEALEKALNKEQVQGTVDVDYKYENDLNGKASKIWENEMKDKSFTLSTKTLSQATVNDKTYLYFVVERPEDYKTFGGWITAAQDLDKAVEMQGIAKDRKLFYYREGSEQQQVHCRRCKGKGQLSAFTTTPRRATDGQSGSKTVNYVVVVFEVAPKA